MRAKDGEQAYPRERVLSEKSRYVLDIRGLPDYEDSHLD